MTLSTVATPGRVRLRTALLAVVVAAMTVLAGLALAPAASAGKGKGPVPAEFAMAEVLKPKKCARAGRQAGWRGSELVIATAISLAESGCNPDAVGTNPPTSGCPNGSRDRGAWQINDCYHPSVSDTCAFDLHCNADAAYQIYEDRGDTFQPWTTYNTRAFKYFLNEARRAVKQITDRNIVVGVVTTAGGDLTIRRSPTTDSAAVGTYPSNEVIVVKCQKRGERVYSTVFGYYTKIWDKTGGHQWVSDGYVHTDNNKLIKPC